MTPTDPTPLSAAKLRDMVIEELDSHLSEGWSAADVDRYAEAKAKHIKMVDALVHAATLDARELDVERIRDARLLMIDGIASDLSREFAQGDPFEPFDRVYVVKRLTAILDAARSRANQAALSETSHD